MNDVVIIRDVRPWGRESRDLVLTDGRISHVAARGEVGADALPGATVIAGGGRIAIPSFTDAHVHLDSTRLGLPFRPHTGGVTVLEQVMNDRRNWRTAGASVADRAAYTWGLAIRSGATRGRSYAQIDTDCRLERFEGVLAAREAHARRARLEVIAFPQAGIIRDPGTLDLLRQAMAEGADTIGGIDPCALDRDPKGQLDAVFSLADSTGAAVDIHLHEPGELGLFTLGLILERVRVNDLRGRVTVSHAFALGQQPLERTASLLDELAELDVALTTAVPTSERRLPLHALSARGIRVGLGQDGQRDYWSPYGNGDMLDRTWQLAWSNGFRRDDDIELCVAVATVGGAAVMGLPEGRRPTSSVEENVLQHGDRADLVLLHGDTLTAAVMDRSGGRTVIHDGAIVAEDGELVA